MFKPYNGLAVISGIITVAAAICWVFSIVDVFTKILPKDSVFGVFMSVSAALPIFIFISLLHSWTYTGSLNLSNAILTKDLRYLGLQESSNWKFSLSSKGTEKKNNFLVRWLAYSRDWDGKNSQIRIAVEQEGLVLRLSGNLDAATHIANIFKKEKALIKSLKKSKSYDEAKAKKGLPLVTYLMLSDGCTDVEARAVVLKKHEVDAITSFMANQLASSADDLEQFIDLPLAWLCEATGVQDYASISKLSII